MSSIEENMEWEPDHPHLQKLHSAKEFLSAKGLVCELRRENNLCGHFERPAMLVLTMRKKYTLVVTIGKKQAFILYSNFTADERSKSIDTVEELYSSMVEMLKEIPVNFQEC
jgi:hypothetical protein